MNRFVEWIKNLAQEERGNVSLIVAGGLVVYLGFLGLVTDFGQVYVERQRLFNSLDAGALAGIQEILKGQSGAESVAVDYASRNGASDSSAVANTQALTVQVSSNKSVPLDFAKLFGLSQANISVSVEAQAGTLAAGTGFVPIAVPDQEFHYGQSYQLTQGAGNGSSGNYGFLDFDGGGANNLENNIKYGYNGTLRIGQQVLTKPGVNSGPVESAIRFRLQADSGHFSCQSIDTIDHSCSRLMVLPVIDSLNVNGKKPVTIVGFAAFFLDGLSGSGGHQQIMGRFIRVVYPGEMGNSKSYGTYSVKLVH